MSTSILTIGHSNHTWESFVSLLKAQEVEIDPSSPIQDTWQGDLLGGVTTLALAGFAIDNSQWHGNVYMSVAGSDEVAQKPVRLTAVPYFAWANRGPNAMRVWVPTAEVS